MNLIPAILSFALLAGCTSTVEVDYTPDESCQRWCSLEATCGNPRGDTCVPRCLEPQTCATERRAHTNCIVDTYDLSHECGAGACRCADLESALMACMGGAS